MNSPTHSEALATGDEARVFLGECLPSIREDLKRLVTYARQSGYHDNVLWSDPVFRSKVAALQAEYDAVEHTLGRAAESNEAGGNLTLLAGLTASDLRQKVSGLLAEALGPFGLARNVAADDKAASLEAAGADSILSSPLAAPLDSAAAARFRKVIADAAPRMATEGARSGLSQSEQDLLAGNRDNWGRLAEMGWLGQGIPEAAGGHGGALSAMMLVAQRLGATLATAPFTGSVVYPSQALQTLLDPAEAAKVLEPAVAGRIRLAVACHEPPARGGLRWTNTRATPHDQGYALNGCKVAVDGGGAATAYLVSARTGGEVYDPSGHSLFLVPRDTPGLKVHAWRMIDGSDMATVELDDVVVAKEALLGEPGTALASLSAGMDAAIVSNAFAVVGAMETVIADLAPLPCCTDMLVELEQARSAALIGLASLTQADGRHRAHVTSVTKAIVVRSSEHVCQQAARMHQGMDHSGLDRARLFRDYVESLNAPRGTYDFHLSRMAMLM